MVLNEKTKVNRFGPTGKKSVLTGRARAISGLEFIRAYFIGIYIQGA